MDGGDIVLIGLRGIGDAGTLILHHEIQVVADSHRENTCDAIHLACARNLYRGFGRRRIRRLHRLHFVVELIGFQCAHERHGREQLPCFDEVEPCIPILSLFLERTRLVPEPCSIVPTHLTRPRIEPSQFPVVTYLLQYERKSGWRFCGDVQDHDPILARGQIRNLEDRAVRRLSRSPEDAAEKFGASNGGRSLRLEQKWGPCLGLGPRKI